MDLNTMKLEALFEQLVPAEGSAETVAGEIVRAANRLIYRAYNDGDLFWRDYGIETVGSVYMYFRSLADYELENNDLYNHLLDVLEAMEFTDYINKQDLLQDFVDAIVDVVEQNPSLTTMHNTDDCIAQGYYELAVDRFGDPYAEDEDLDEYDEDSYDPDGEYGSDY